MTAEYEELRRRLLQEVFSLKLRIDAADAIEALLTENKKLREALVLAKQHIALFGALRTSDGEFLLNNKTVSGIVSEIDAALGKEGK